jgi:hypothetical protein
MFRISRPFLQFFQPVIHTPTRPIPPIITPSLLLASQGQRFLNEKKAKEALECAKKAILADPSNTVARELYVQAGLATGQLEPEFSRVFKS